MERRPVRQLSAETARKIAAGEVIERPSSIVRELLDNAVDSGADKIEVEITGGGIEKIRISDNGSGFSKEDLFNCARPHATSKISDAQDLLKLSTLGFRGEALASIASVSRLSIFSGNHKMRSSITEDHIIEEIASVQNGVGSIIQSEGLFENFPARRQFLKRPATEAVQCKDIFVEKALPRPDISFRFSSDGELKLDLASGVTLSERFVEAMGLTKPSELFFEIAGSGGNSLGSSTGNGNNDTDWSFRLVIGDPSIYRTDRKQIFIYVNGRKITEYALVQAIEYGCQGFFPNGVHPVACLFVEMNPSLVDFNIHPAKKEARFKDIGSLHHGVSSATKSFFRSWTVKNLKDGEPFVKESLPSSTPSLTEESELPLEITEQPAWNLNSRTRFFGGTSTTKSFSSGAFPNFSTQKSEPSFKAPSEIIKSAPTRATPAPSFTDFPSVAPSLVAESLMNDFSESNAPNDIPDSDGFRYLGTALRLFFVCEFKGELYLIDQHAAHERILFDKIINAQKTTQKLLVPFKIRTDSIEEDVYLENVAPELLKVGFHLEKSKNEEGIWEINETPIDWKGSEAALIKDILRTRVEPKEIGYKLSATRACKKAVKDGYVLDRIAASEIAKEALTTLSDPHCPHGRPIWIKLTKEELFERVRRT